MEHNLYDVLGVTRDASPEQIKKAYRKKALATHPDRLPPDSSEEDKVLAAENFRSVNNAYEVLIEPENRKLYDLHGVWPPEHKDEPHYRSSHHRHEPSHSHQTFNGAFPGPMFSFSSGPFGTDHHRHHPASHFSFTDPFSLFNSIFGDFARGGPADIFATHYHGDPHSRRHEYAGNRSDDYHHSHDYEDPSHHRRRLNRSQDSFFPLTSTSAFLSTPRGFASVGRWTQESKVITTVNGVTQTVCQRTDSDGNVHVTKTYPDGREKYTVNGVEQSSQRQDRYIDRGDRGHHGGGYPLTNDMRLGIPHSYGHRDNYHHGPRSDYRHHERVIPDPNMYDGYSEDQKRSWWRR